jgi:hypothetical protein
MTKKIIILCALFLGILSQSNAQCTGAVVDSVCFASLIGAGGGICKDSLPNGMANNYYSEDVSFVMPPSVNITTPITATVTLRRINITGVGGMPLGIDYACNNGTCIYLPSSGQQLGAMRFCGTPLTAGLYTLTVYISADVTVSGIGDRNGEAQTYTTRLRILPDTSGGNATFTHTPAGNKYCDTTDITYNATITSSNPVKYNWTFGNGNTSTLQNPPAQTYTPSGTDYQAILNTTLYSYRITRVRVLATDGSLWSGDVGEPTTFLTYPDFVFANTTTGRATPEIGNNRTPDWTGLRDTIPVGTDSISFTLTDIDGSLFGLDPNDLVEAGKFGVTLGTVNYIRGGNSLQITMDTVPTQIFRDTFTFTVNPALTSGITSTLIDSFCFGDSTIVSVNYNATDYTLQWYNDSTEIPLANDSFIISYGNGNYYVTIQNNTTLCTASSNITSTYGFTAPPAIVNIVNAGPGQIANSNFPGAGFTIEWFKDGVLIPGASGVLLTTTGDGVYTCHVFNTAFPNCDGTSGNFVITGINDIDNTLATNLNIYPNPSNGKFTLSFETLSNDKEATLSINDVTGREVYATNLKISKGANQLEINANNIANGLYIAKLKVSGSTIEKRLFINK